MGNTNKEKGNLKVIEDFGLKLIIIIKYLIIGLFGLISGIIVSGILKNL